VFKQARPERQSTGCGNVQRLLRRTKELVVDVDLLPKKEAPPHDDARGGAVHRPRFPDRPSKTTEVGGGA
jgi:hypothetical protein